jgi:hypothetical protein
VSYYTELERRAAEVEASDRALREVARLQQKLIHRDIAISTWQKVSAILLGLLIACLFVLVMEGGRHVQ